MLITENRKTDTKPNTNNNHGKISKPNQLFTKLSASHTYISQGS